MANVRAAVKITGRVQGVWFRQSTKQAVEQHGVSGWVRNNPDGSVEAVFEGEKEAVEAVIEWCKDGPQLAQVNAVQVDWQAVTGEFSSFQIR